MDELEARVGIEPTYKGFADLSLTTWVPRLIVKNRLRSFASLRISPAGSRSSELAHARKTAQLGYRAEDDGQLSVDIRRQLPHIQDAAKVWKTQEAFVILRVLRGEKTGAGDGI